MEGNVDLQVNAFYSEHYAGAVVIARVGNPASEEITIADVELRVADVGTLIPQRMHGGLFVEGYDWCDAAPQPLPARGFRKLAWYFYSGELHDRITKGSQPVPAHLSLELYPPTGAVSADIELYTLARIRELAGEAVDV
jgi:hypothetical protein